MSSLNAVTRFFARCGHTSTISDNGSNVVAALKELKAFMDEWDEAMIACDVAQEKIILKFKQAVTPHFEVEI